MECEWRVCVSFTESCYPPFARRAKGEVFVLLYVCLFGQRFLSNRRANSRHILHAAVAWIGTCLRPFWGLAAPGGRKRRQMKFSLLWESMGNFCILTVFERYLSNACTDPHQILFVYGQCLPTCPRGPIYTKVPRRAYSGSRCVFSPFGGWRPPAGGKRGK